MTNKEKLKMAIEQDIDAKNNYNEIIKKIEKGAKMKNKNNLWKLSLVPICLVVIISGIVIINNNTSLFSSEYPSSGKTYVDKENNITLYINDLKNVGLTTLDADIKIGSFDSNMPYPYKNGIKLPDDLDLDKNNSYIVYTRDNNSDEYNILNNYVLVYSNSNEDRNIAVSYSQEHKPIRDYLFDENGSKISVINGIELKIYKYESTYFTEFKYNNYNFDIETTNITEQELSTLLASILK